MLLHRIKQKHAASLQPISESYYTGPRESGNGAEMRYYGDNNNSYHNNDDNHGYQHNGTTSSSHNGKYTHHSHNESYNKRLQNGKHSPVQNDNFVRGGLRQSTMGVLSNDSEWESQALEAMDKQIYGYNGELSFGKRQPPEGRKMSDNDDYTEDYEPIMTPSSDVLPWFYNDSQEIFVENDGTPWGLQVFINIYNLFTFSSFAFWYKQFSCFKSNV